MENNELLFDVHALTANLMRDINKKKDDLIRTSLQNAGFDSNDLESFKSNFTFIIQDGSEYDHLYYHFGLPDQKRIISFGSISGTLPSFEYASSEFNKTTVSLNYY